MSLDWIGRTVPWWAKVILLLAGIRYKLLGLVYLFLDGRFHWTATLERLQRESPDWIIAQRALGLRGAFSLWVHKWLMGVPLMLGASFALYDILFARGPLTMVTRVLVNVVMPVVLVIIAAGITVKNVLLQSTDNKRVAFL